MDKESSKLNSSRTFIIILVFVSFHTIFFSLNLTSGLTVWLSSGTKYICRDTFHASKLIHLADAIDVLDKRNQSRPAFFMIETSKSGVVHGRQACAVESLAKNHPHADVYLLVLHPSSDLRVDTNEQLSMVHRHYRNVRFLSLRMGSLVKGTVLEHWYANGSLDKSSYIKVHTSDVIRALIVQKYGGTYIDLDFIVVRSFANLSESFVSYQMSSDFNNAIFGFKKNHHVPRLMLEYVRDKYEPWNFGSPGPVNILKSLEAYCGLNATEMVQKGACNDVQVYSRDYFYPVAYTVWWVLFENTTKERLDTFNASYAIHFSNFMSKNEIVRIGSNQVYSTLAKEHCPRAYWSSYEVF